MYTYIKASYLMEKIIKHVKHMLNNFFLRRELIANIVRDSDEQDGRLIGNEGSFFFLNCTCFSSV